MKKQYNLVNESLHKVFGTISFNGKFVFKLADDVSSEVWNKIGIIPLPKGSREKVIAGDQFYYLNSRLPQKLRSAKISDKLKYVDETKLSVASDSFILEQV